MTYIQDGALFPIIEELYTSLESEQHQVDAEFPKQGPREEKVSAIQPETLSETSVLEVECEVLHENFSAPNQNDRFINTGLSERLGLKTRLSLLPDLVLLGEPQLHFL